MSEQPVAGNTPTTNPLNLTHYPALDGLRAVAFVLVFLIHYQNLPWGFAGVNFFFVLSGFLITGILYDSRDQPGRAKRFYVRRALRIFPLYYGVMLLTVLMTPWMQWIWSWPWMAWPLYLGNFLRLWGHGVNHPAVRSVAYGQLHSRAYPEALLFFGHFWSLCVEEQFYLFWPWMVFGIRSRRRLLAVCVLAIALCPLLRSLVENHGPGWMYTMVVSESIGIPLQLDALLLGALLALIWRSRYRAALQRFATLALAVLTLAGLGYGVRVLAMYPLGRVCELYQYPDWSRTWDLSLVNLYGAALLVCALRPGSWTYRALNRGALRSLGRISYGAYVFHDLPHTYYRYLGEGCVGLAHLDAGYAKPVTAAIAFCSTVVLAALSFRFFETPFLALKERLAPARSYASGVLVS